MNGSPRAVKSQGYKYQYKRATCYNETKACRSNMTQWRMMRPIRIYERASGSGFVNHGSWRSAPFPQYSVPPPLFCRQPGTSSLVARHYLITFIQCPAWQGSMRCSSLHFPFSASAPFGPNEDSRQVIIKDRSRLFSWPSEQMLILAPFSTNQQR